MVYGRAQTLAYTWARSAGAGSEQEALAVTADLSGNVYATGYIKGPNNNFSSLLISSVGVEDIFLAKYDLDGNIIWVRAAGGNGDDRGTSITVDNAGNIYISGHIHDGATFFGSPNITVTGTGDDVFIAKYNSSGDVVWVKRENSTSGGAAYGICTNGTDVFLTGEFSSNITFGALPTLNSSGGVDAFIASLNASTGAENWSIKAGSSSTDIGNGIAVDATGVYVTGSYESTITFQNMAGTFTNSGNGDVFTVKYNLSGTGIWKRKAGGSGDERESSISVSGNFVYVAGHFSGTMSMFNTGPAVGSVTAASGDDAFLIQWDATTGNYSWVRSENGTGLDHALGVAANPAGDVFLTGYFNGTLPCGSGPSITSSVDDIFVTKYNSAGTFQWGKKVAGAADDYGRGIVAPDNTSVYISGGYKSSPATFDAFTISTSSNFDIFVAKLGCTCTVAGAGPDQTFCASSVATLAGNTPITGTGVWTLVSGTGTIDDPSSPTSTLSALNSGAHVFQWTITNSVCPASTFDQVTITIDSIPTPANAGPDQNFCTSSTTLAGNTPTIGTGIWTRISGTGAATTPSSPASGVTGLAVGSSVYQWTVTNGVCPSSTDQVTLTVDPNPTPANAGPNQTICSPSAVFAGNNPAIGTGAWTLVSGTGVITNSASPTSPVNSLMPGTNTFQWTISNGTCPSSSDQVNINVDANPTTPNAGPDQTICSSSSVFAANIPAIGSGVWTLISGTGTIAVPSSATSTVTGLSIGANVFRWTISNGTCPSAFDEITITRDATPTTANAGPDQNICATTATLAGNAPVIGSGIWTLISGTGVITAPSSTNSTVNGLSVGANVFQWTISNGVCAASSDQVTINVDPFPTVANAGPDQSICSGAATLAGNAPVTGTGFWSLISGTGTITSPTSPTSGLTGLSVGANVFRWTITSGTCPTSFDNVTITRDANPTTANAGADQTLCTSTTNLAGNVPAIGAGVWTLISGSGSATTPSSNTSGVTGLTTGATVFQWTISNGTCPSSSDQVTINHDANPTAANAGVDQTICSSSATFAGNIPSTGTGLWTLISGTGIVTTPTSAASTVTGLSVGANVFQWTISNGTCPSSSDQVTIFRDPNPTVANAGVDQTICSSSASFAGNNPAIGTGVWTLISGTGTIVTPTSPASAVNGLSIGANVFQWTISNGTCPSSSDQVTITRDANPSVANAGPDQTICASATTFAGNNPAIGAGAWTLVSGTGTIVSPSLPTSAVNGLGIGTNVFQWTISNGTCPSSSDQVIITRDPNPTTANAGSDQTICASSTTLAGNSPAIGTGIWTLISGTGTIVTPTSPTSSVTGLSIGANVFEWTISNGTCPSSSDQVTINVDPNPTTASAGPNQTICSSAATFAGNAPTIGTGVWTLISGTGTVVTPSSPISSVTGLSVGANVFQWTISNGTCPASSDQVVITRDANPTTANAGADQTICSSSSSLAGNAPVIGNGTWTLISGPATISAPTSNTSAVTGMSPGTATFEWTISNGTCPSTSDQATIYIDANPSLANAGADQAICSSSASISGNVPSIGNGVWTLISGTGIIATPSSTTSAVTGLSIGANIFQWTITNGTCPSSSDQVTINVDANPTIANAGPDQTICSAGASLNGNTPAVGTGTWYLISGTGTVVTPNSPASVVNGLSPGANVFKWEITNGTCPASNDVVTIYHDSAPTASNAGADQTICSSVATLSGNIPTTGSGNWTLISGTGNIVSPGSSTTAITGLGIGANVFEWTISNGTCPSSSDQVVINVDANPTIANAGSDQTLCSSATVMAGNIPLTGNGIWNVISGSGIISNPSQPLSGVTNLVTGINLFDWVITNGVCPSSHDTVAVIIDQYPTIANAGPDQQICASSSVMNGNIPSVGTGSWVVISSTGNFANASVPTTAISNMGIGANTFEWVITNGTCPASHDTVTIFVDDFPSAAIAGPDQLICSSTSALQAVNPSIGTGTWSVLSGPSTVTNVLLPNSPVSNLAPGQNEFKWVVTNGVCPVSSDTVQIYLDSLPTMANAGVSQIICSSASSLNANIPISGSGQWYVVSSSASLANATQASTGVSGLGIGQNLFEWVISNGVCPGSRDTVSITVDENPTQAVAGIDALICDPFDTLTGNIPLVGAGTWYSLSSPPVIWNPFASTTAVTNLAAGTNAFEWVISNGTCPVTRDTVSIFYTLRPSAPNAGPDIYECAYDVTMQGEIPSTGTGYWTNLSNTGSFSDPANPNSVLNNVPDGAYAYTWTTSNSYCVSRADTVFVTVYSPPSLAYAGPDQLVHTTFATLEAIECDTGYGTWTFVSGSGVIHDLNDPKSRVTELANGINILRWTTSNGVCATTEDDMQIESKALIIPTGYSPNADGTNDAFEIEGLLEYSNVSLEIFNRWGNRVYVSSDYKNDWSGAGGNGETLPDDIYYYVLKLEDGTAFNGYVALKRKSS